MQEIDQKYWGGKILSPLFRSPLSIIDGIWWMNAHLNHHLSAEIHRTSIILDLRPSCPVVTGSIIHHYLPSLPCIVSHLSVLYWLSSQINNFTSTSFAHSCLLREPNTQSCDWTHKGMLGIILKEAFGSSTFKNLKAKTISISDFYWIIKTQGKIKNNMTICC